MANELATSLTQVTRYSDEAIISAENILLTFTKVKDDVFPGATAVILDMSTALGQDLQSSAIQVGKALNDPIKGVTALQRVGVSFTASQKETIKALVEMGDVAGAQALILQELQVEFGGSAEAAGQTLAGQLDILKNALGNVAEEVGTALLPQLTTLAQKAGPVVIDLFEDLGEEIIPMVTDTVSDLATEIVNLLSDFNDLRQAVDDAGEAAVNTNMSYEEYLETVGEGGGIAKFATGEWWNLLKVIGGGGVILNAARDAIGLLNEEEFENIQLLADAETATDGWVVRLEDGGTVI